MTVFYIKTCGPSVEALHVLTILHQGFGWRCKSTKKNALLE
jgi:hypothetical protein